MKTIAYTRPWSTLCGNAAAHHGNAAAPHGGARARPGWRAWLAAGLLAFVGGGATAAEDEPGFPNFAQLASISVGGVAANFPVGLEEDPLHVTVPPLQIGHCAPQVITLTGWQPNARRHEVSALGQNFYLDGDTPTRSLSAAPLAFGSNAVEINVSRYMSSGTWSRVRYSLTIERTGPGTDAELTGMALSSGTLTPAFDPAITSYSATVDQPSVAVAATAADCPEITVNGQPVASGSAAQVPLAVGPNTVTVQSTAQNGATRTFTLALTRTASANADLQGLTLSAGTLNPAFSGAVTRYTAAVPYMASLAVTPTPAVSTATLTVNGAPAAAGSPQFVALQAGTTAINVGVTAEDGSSTRMYTVDIARAAPSTDARLAAITLSAGVLSPAFDPAVLVYSASVAHATDALQIAATPAFGDATVTVNGTPAPAGHAVSVPLVPGLNTIAVQATAQDGTTQQTYTLRVVRASAINSARLLGLALSSGAPWPPVHPATLAYTARVASTTAAITLTPTPEDATASILINGSPVATGEASAPIPLQPGHNAITLQMTSTDGQQTARYTLDVLRGSADAALASLTLSDGSLGPAFDPAVLAYSASVPFVMTSVRVGLTLGDAEATARVGQRVLRSGHAAAMALAPGLNTVPVQVTSSDGTVQRTYQLRITREAAGAVSLSGNPAQFGAPQSYALSGDFVAAVGAQDIDGDGLPDALALEYTRPELALLRGRGDGSLDAVQWLPLGASGAQRLAVGDVHGDGWPDVLTGGSAQTLLAVGTGAGLGTAGLAVQPLASASSPPSLLVDVDGDGRDDIVSTGQAQGVVVLLSLGDNRFAAAQAVGTLSGVQHLQAQDVDGDGRMDLLLANESSTLQLLLGAGGGTFGAPQDVALGATGQFRLFASPRLADVDGDGRADLVAAAQSNDASVVFILKGLPSGGFGGPVRLASGWPTYIGQELPRDLAVDDFNGDGHPDLAVLNSNGGFYNVTILAGQGDGSFAVLVRHLVPWAPNRMAVADFNADGKPDLLLDTPMGGGGGLKRITNTSPDLAQLAPSHGTLAPAFSGDVTEYTLQMPAGSPALTLTPWLAFGTATVRVGGVVVDSGSASAPITVPAGGTVPITVQVQARDGSTRTYTIQATGAVVATVAVTATANPATGGTAVCAPGQVVLGANATCTATASAGYQFDRWTGACAGQGATCQLTNLQTDEASVALFAQRQTLSVAEGPLANQPLLLTLPAGNGWQVAEASTHSAASTNAPLPQGVTLPYGVVSLRLDQGVQGSQATVVLTYPQPLPQDAVYYKFGRTADNAQPHWYPFPGARISGNTVTLTLQDGGAGDDDRTQNSVIQDPGGVALLAPLPPGPGPAQAIPTLHGWGLGLLSLLIALLAWPRWRSLGHKTAPGA